MKCPETREGKAQDKIKSSPHIFDIFDSKIAREGLLIRAVFMVRSLRYLLWL